ncbi:5-formyltetrahydrofolate cyclo-ligase [Candidatus Pelagibacter sp.]|nr:5-formyltetrahydrofolate cyclo-ligase [Candidatus Pelagibacter sp.]
MIKEKLRSKILKLRKNYSINSIKLNPTKIYTYLKQNNYKFKSIGGYYPSNYEIDDLEILNYFILRGSSISLPIVKKNNEMDFYKWSNEIPLEINKYGIPEPISEKKLYPDILFVPLVGYDYKLNRLGYGGGYYDRYIDKMLKIKNTIKIGLAFSYQKLKKIPINKHDKKLDIIITEKKFIT